MFKNYIIDWRQMHKIFVTSCLTPFSFMVVVAGISVLWVCPVTLLLIGECMIY